MTHARLEADRRSAALGFALLAAGAALALVRGGALPAPPGAEVLAAAIVAALGIDLAATRAWLARERAGARFVRIACVVLECAVVAAAVGATGVTSSPLLALAPLLVVAYAQVAGRAQARACAAALAMLHGAVFALASSGAGGAVFPPPTGSTLASALALALVASGYAAALATAVAPPAHEAREIDAARPRAPAPAEPARIGGTLAGAYRIVALLGRGGTGTVYRAVRIADEREVAVKILSARLADVPEAAARLRREVDVVSRLPAELVAPVLDVGTSEDGLPYVVMELLDGVDLGAHLDARGRLPLGELVVLVETLAKVLDVAHARGVVHRDVKPRNVFLATRADGTRDVRLLDFGVARLYDAAWATRSIGNGEIVGTPGYLAPEQVAEGFGEVAPPTDVFALGALVYRALTGRPAFVARDTAAATYEVLHVHPPHATTLAPSLPADVDDVLAIALAKRPADRYPSAGALASDLRAASEGALSASARDRARALAPRRDGGRSATATI